MSIRVTAVDTENGDTETAEIENDYVLVCAGTCRLVHTNITPGKGNVTITLTGRQNQLIRAPLRPEEQPDHA